VIVLECIWLAILRGRVVSQNEIEKREDWESRASGLFGCIATSPAFPLHHEECLDDAEAILQGMSDGSINFVSHGGSRQRRLAYIMALAMADREKFDQYYLIKNESELSSALDRLLEFFLRND
jgi:hypothetical protein